MAGCHAYAFAGCCPAALVDLLRPTSSGDSSGRSSFKNKNNLV